MIAGKLFEENRLFLDDAEDHGLAKLQGAGPLLADSKMGSPSAGLIIAQVLTDRDECPTTDGRWCAPGISAGRNRRTESNYDQPHINTRPCRDNCKCQGRGPVS